MEEMEIMEIEYTEGSSDSGNIIVDLAVQLGITTLAVIAGNAICYGIGEAAKAVKRASRTHMPKHHAKKEERISDHLDDEVEEDIEDDDEEVAEDEILEDDSDVEEDDED